MLLDEKVILMGWRTNEGFGTYVPSDVDDRPAIELRPADWGELGYNFVIERDDGVRHLVQLNLRDPGDLSSAPGWVPSYLAGGQATDPTRDTVAFPPNEADKIWQAFDCTTHVGERGLAMNGQNPALNDGQPAAKPFVLGPFEYEVWQEVDAP